MGYLDDESLLRLAVRTVHTRWFDPLVNVEQAESQVGFNALKLPDENARLFTLVGASVDPKSASSHPGLSLPRWECRTRRAYFYSREVADNRIHRNL